MVYLESHSQKAFPWRQKKRKRDLGLNENPDFNMFVDSDENLEWDDDWPGHLVLHCVPDAAEHVRVDYNICATERQKAPAGCDSDVLLVKNIS